MTIGVDDIDYDTLDSGIRETVRWLRSCGYDTVDSGDGKEKFAPGEKALPMQPTEDGEGMLVDCRLDFPHVFIRIEPHMLVTQANVLRDLLRDAGIVVTPCSPDGVSIQGSYDPVDSSAMLMIHGLHDGLWPAGGKSLNG